jgi:membrane protease YdiL (CAAX protease family)
MNETTSEWCSAKQKLYKTLSFKQSEWYPKLNQKEASQQLLIGVLCGLGLQKINQLYDHYTHKSDMARNKVVPIAFKNSKPLNPKLSSISTVVVGSLIFPIIEEIFYRGILRQETKIYNMTSSQELDNAINMWANAGIFAFSHFKNRKNIPFYFIAGCILWQLAEKSNNLWAVTIAHSTKNILTYKNSYRRNLRKLV